MIFLIIYTSLTFRISAWQTNFIDLSDQNTTSDWYYIGTSDQVKIYEICDISMITLQNKDKIYKNFLTSQDVTSVKFEADLYVQFPSDFIITIFINEQEYSQKEYFTSQIELFPTLCSSYPESSFIQFETIIDFDDQIYNSLSLLFEGQDQALGIRNIVVSTDGIVTDCPPTQVKSVSNVCVDACDMQYQQLQSSEFTTCVTLTQTNVVLFKTYPTSLSLITYNIAQGVWTSDSFKSNGQFQQIFVETFKYSLSLYKIQMTGAIYLIGDWDPGSYVKLRLNYTYDPAATTQSVPTQNPSSTYIHQYYFGNNFYSDNGTNVTVTCALETCIQSQKITTYFYYDLITINKTDLRFQVTSQNLQDVYQTQLTLLNGTRIKVNKVIINTEAIIASNHPYLTFQILHNIKGNDAQFAFQNKLIFYKAFRSNSACSSYQPLLQCVICKLSLGYYLYMGKCVFNCPVHSVKYVDKNQQNCTDLINIETLQYTPNLTQNASGVYLIKEFYNRNFDTNFIKTVFDSYPNNSHTSELYSNIVNNKILGGYGVWGYGGFTKTFNNLPYHYQIRIYCRIYFIDSWQQDDTFSFYIDDQKYDYNIQNIIDENISGKKDLDHKLDIVIKQLHSEDSVTFKFICLGEDFNDSKEKSCGMNNLFIIYDRNVNYICPQQQEFFNQYSQSCNPCSNNDNGCIQYSSNSFFKCDYHCFTCQNSPDYCLSCDPALRRTFNNNQCPCIDGYYELDSQPQCLKCQFPCLKCNQNKCLECTTDKNLVNGNCVCFDGYYETNGKCESCDSLCLTCSSNQDCLSCDREQYRELIDNRCLCLNGFIENTAGECERICTTSYCSKCDQNDQCYECQIGLFRTPNTWNLCTCMLEYYEDTNNICQPICHYSCQTCNQPLSTKLCLTCSEDSYRILSADNQCICADGLEDAGNEKCQQIQDCYYTCDKCYKSNDSSECMSCQQNRELDSKNECSCIQGYQEINKICEIIQDQNQSDEDEQNQSDEDEQNQGDEDEQNQGDEQSQQNEDDQNQQDQGGKDDQNQGGQDQQNENEQNQGNNDDQIQNEEQQQNNEEQTNQDEIETVHHECNDGNELPRDGCYDFTVEAGWFCTVDNSYSLCKRCENSCLSCDSKGTCKVCGDGYFLNDGICFKCKIQCSVCQQTADNCLICSDNTQTPMNGQCKTCDFGYYLQNNRCQSICGDGIIVDTEQCDDANNENLDGCSSLCQIEKDFECKNLYCNPKPVPTKIVNLFTNNQVIVELLNIQSICSELKVKIDIMDQIKFTYNISQIEQTTIKLKCQIDFLFYQDIKPFNIIHVYIVKQSRLLADDEIELTIQPQKQYYFSSKQLEQSNILLQLYQVTLYFVIGMIPMSIIFKEFHHLCIDFIVAVQYLFLFNADYSIYLQDILTANIWSLMYFEFPFQVYQENILENKLTKLNRDHFIASNIWVSSIIILVLFGFKKITILFKSRQERILKQQTRPTTSKNTQQFTFRFEKTLQKISKFPQEEKLIALRNFIKYQSLLIYKLIDIFSFDIAFSIFVQLFYITNLSQSLIYNVINFILLIICTILCIFWTFQFYQQLYKKQEHVYYLNQIITKTLFILIQLVFEQQQWKAGLFCSITYTVSALQYFFICKDYKFKDFLLILILLSITYIQIKNEMMIYIDLGIIGSIFLYILGNIIFVTYKIIHHYI